MLASVQVEPECAEMKTKRDLVFGQALRPQYFENIVVVVEVDNIQFDLVMVEIVTGDTELGDTFVVFVS